MDETLTKLTNLEKIYESGLGDDRLSIVVDKIVADQIQKYKEDIRTLEGDLKIFEEKYSMDSDTFYDQWQKGNLNDNADFFEWSALYQMGARTTKRLGLLKNKNDAAT